MEAPPLADVLRSRLRVALKSRDLGAVAILRVALGQVQGVAGRAGRGPLSAGDARQLIKDLINRGHSLRLALVRAQRDADAAVLGIEDKVLRSVLPGLGTPAQLADALAACPAVQAAATDEGAQVLALRHLRRCRIDFVRCDVPTVVARLRGAPAEESTMHDFGYGALAAFRAQQRQQRQQPETPPLLVEHAELVRLLITAGHTADAATFQARLCAQLGSTVRIGDRSVGLALPSQHSDTSTSPPPPESTP